MKAEDIAKLPTPETDGHDGFYEILRCCKSLEQRLAVAMESLRWIKDYAYQEDQETITRLNDIYDIANETLASIRSMK